MGNLDNNERLNSFVEGYNKTVYNNYNHIEEHFDEAFPLIKFKGYLSSCTINVERDFFGSDMYFLIVDNYKFQNSNYDFTKITNETKRLLVDLDKHERIEKFISNTFPETNTKHVFYLDDILFDSKETLSQSGKYFAEKDYKSWRKENNTSVNNYNHDTISPYSHLDYDGLIQTFNSKKYNEDFSYQMNQAEECYKRKLYLPAAATLSVALETVLMAICEKEDVNLKTKESTDTMMNYLGERLLQEKVINYRMHKRIDVTYSLRNSVSHSNPGEVSKADCQIILSCIKVLIDEHYSK
ncbi:hypothetical protein BUY93_09935 [Mammaliicoccus fleurettii]|nr:hypothetical protein BUY93_09935 [Mammaliicoccus fleurettii]